MFAYLPLLVVLFLKHSESVDRTECNSRFGVRSYVPQELQKEKAAYLYTFPGSGNTWARLLLDYATGYYTGSIYKDKLLMDILPGERWCGAEVSLIKAHPNHNPAKLLHAKVRGCHRLQRAIFLIRDPYDSIWSEYQLIVSGQHIGGIRVDAFNWKDWIDKAIHMSNKVNDMWGTQYKYLEQTLPKEDIMLTQYEHLKDPNKRFDSVEQIVRFLNYSTPDLRERVECSFLLADSTGAHRPVPSSAMMTKDKAYESREIVCGIWAIFGEFVFKYGYRPWHNMNCTGFVSQEKHLPV